LTQCMEELATGAITPDAARENVTEELGDLFFYCVGVAKTAECQHPRTPEYADSVLTAFSAADFSVVESFYGLRWDSGDHAKLAAQVACVTGAAGKLFDVGKQWFIYNKPFDRKALEVAVLVLRHMLGAVRLTWQLTEQEIEEYNRKKLQLRYNKLVYNDQHAQDRADKK